MNPNKNDNNGMTGAFSLPKDFSKARSPAQSSSAQSNSAQPAPTQTNPSPQRNPPRSAARAPAQNRSNPVQRSAAQPSAIQPSAIQHSAIQHSAVQHSAVQHSAVQHNTGSSSQSSSSQSRSAPRPQNVLAQSSTPRNNASAQAPRTPARNQSAQRAPARSSSRRPAAKAKKLKKPEPRYDVAESGINSISSLLKAMIYIVSVTITSIVLAIVVIRVGNDVFAFVKSDEAIEITIGEYATVSDIADILEENGVISYPSIFRLYAAVKKDNGKFVAGTYTVSPMTNYSNLLSTFKYHAPPREQVSITIPEGYTVDNIIELFVSKGMGTREGFVEAIENYDFDYWFIKELETNRSPDRKYRLEGYLFPDTYYFYTDWSEVNIINKLLARFDALFTDEYREYTESLGYTTDQIVTLASMIQMEAKYADEYGRVSSVFHNRLNNPGMTNGYLESDATIQYALSERKSVMTHEDTELDSPYNTYKHKGLPPGPITNPSLNAISFALNPDDTNYYYFVANSSGHSLFAETHAEHLKNVQLVRSEASSTDAG